MVKGLVVVVTVVAPLPLGLVAELGGDVTEKFLSLSRSLKRSSRSNLDCSSRARVVCLGMVLAEYCCERELCDALDWLGEISSGWLEPKSEDCCVDC